MISSTILSLTNFENLNFLTKKLYQKLLRGKWLASDCNMFYAGPRLKSQRGDKRKSLESEKTCPPINFGTECGNQAGMIQ